MNKGDRSNLLSPFFERRYYMSQVQFKSRHQNYIITLPKQYAEVEGERIMFTNGIFKTENPRHIAALRAVAALEAGSIRSVEETLETDALVVSGSIHLELAGLPYKKIICRDMPLHDVMEEIKKAVEFPQAQLVNRQDQIVSITTPVAPYSTSFTGQGKTVTSTDVKKSNSPKIRVTGSKRTVKTKEKVA